MRDVKGGGPVSGDGGVSTGKLICLPVRDLGGDVHCFTLQAKDVQFRRQPFSLAACRPGAAHATGAWERA